MCTQMCVRYALPPRGGQRVPLASVTFTRTSEDTIIYLPTPQTPEQKKSELTRKYGVTATCEAEQSRRARRGREQDFAEISRRMYEEIRSSRDPRDHVEDG